MKVSKTIRGRLIIGISATIIVATMFISTILSIVEFHNIKTDSASVLEDTLAFSIVSLSQPLWDYNLDTVDAILDSTIGFDNVAAIIIKDLEGNVILGKEKKALVEMDEFIIHGEQTIFYNNTAFATIKVSISKYSMQQSVIKRLLFNYLLMFIELSVSVFVLIVLSNKIINPLNEMEIIAKNISDGKLDNVFQCMGDDEVGTLGKELEIMQSQLKSNKIEITNKVLLLESLNQTILQNSNEIKHLYENSIAMNQQLQDLVAETNNSYKITVLALANSIEANDAYTRGHCDRVRHYTMLIAHELGLNEKDIEHLEYASVLHDIGKIGIPYSILNKVDKLTDSEFETIKRHPVTGHDIIKDIKFLKESAKIVLQHHEKEDGSGYPNRLISNDISLGAKILSVADAFDAMTTSRPYRQQPLSDASALNQLIQGSGHQFNELVVQAFIRALETTEDKL